MKLDQHLFQGQMMLSNFHKKKKHPGQNVFHHYINIYWYDVSLVMLCLDYLFGHDFIYPVRKQARQPNLVFT